MLRRSHPLRRALPLMAATAVLLAGCFGGDDDAAPPPVTPQADPLAAVPASAQQSGAGLTAYLTTLNAQPSDTREPIALDGVTLPQDDSGEPTPL